ncbi:hypothetical protein AJ80_02478 [Polytolypa hystricis UAMH7299]|uniref:Uncharacterized protein n=1 Tax=Polytolypa hystricis (strain UAMH7299) TaxID=1447883 RepID=A0A2B7YHG2_POLH7|nr:hypothetical protein AJ80_02478 [Polytolypa hystricis UAMH7299]
MSTWDYYYDPKCIRCFKPRKVINHRQRFMICASCRLAVSWAEPGDIPYEPKNVSIGITPDLYRDHLLGLRPDRLSADIIH